MEARLDFAPVIFRGPVAREFLRRRERHALRKVRDGFLLRKSCRRDTPSQFGEFRVRSSHLKRTNRRRFQYTCEHCHHGLLRSQFATAFKAPQWQTERQPQSAEMQVKPDVESLAIGETGGSAWIWLIWWIGLFEVNRVIRAGLSETWLARCLWAT